MPDQTSALNLVAVGASAGGVEALIDVAASLPPDLPCAILVVLHMPTGAASALAHILDRNGRLPAMSAVHGTRLQQGVIYVAVPAHHLLVHEDRVQLSGGPTENGHRPAINALFRSVALANGQRAIGVLLSGLLDDGVRGLAAIRSHGGTTIAQSPADARFPALPQRAIDAGVIEHQSRAAEVGALLKQLTARHMQESERDTDRTRETPVS